MIKPAKEPQDLVVLANTERKDARDNAGIDKRVPVFVQYHYTNAQELQRLEEALLQAQRTAEELYLERTDDPRRPDTQTLPGL